ncbi:MAG TPA: hypothetical protein VFD59_07800 [Nocardioidaceae bacterium]|nr:hypothetical protein [Nocardioidaceae bacterium]
MTLTLPLVEIAEPVAEGTATAPLLEVLYDVLTTCAELDPDLFHSTTAAGWAATSLAGLARSAVAALGADPGVALHNGPGVVVIRDLVHAVTLLELAAAGSPGNTYRLDPDGFVAAATAAYAVLRQAVPANA